MSKRTVDLFAEAARQEAQEQDRRRTDREEVKAGREQRHQFTANEHKR